MDPTPRELGESETYDKSGHLLCGWLYIRLSLWGIGKNKELIYQTFSEIIYIYSYIMIKLKIKYDENISNVWMEKNDIHNFIFEIIMLFVLFLELNIK